MTYSCLNPGDLNALTENVEKLMTEFKGKLPKSEGIILHPYARKLVRKEPNRYSRNINHCPNMSDKGNTKMTGVINIVLVRKLPNSERYYSQNSLYTVCV